MCLFLYNLDVEIQDSVKPGWESFWDLVILKCSECLLLSVEPGCELEIHFTDVIFLHTPDVEIQDSVKPG